MPGEAASIERARVGPEPVPAGALADPAAPAAPAGAREWDWDDLYARLGRGLVALGRRRYLLTREDAEEALQRAATSILLAAPSVRCPEAYLTSVFLRECLGIRKRQQERQRRELPVPDGFDAPDESCERIQVACRFRRAFSLLSPFCRAVMRSCLLDGKPRAAAAAAVSASGATIYKRYRKCLRTLAHALG